MKAYIEERTLSIANYILEERCTVRQAAKAFAVSKSTVHKDMAERLVSINPALACQVQCLFDENRAERHIRGGQATKEKYRRDRERIQRKRYNNHK